jgi:N-acetylglucosaminyldiphosphoundecaprenol N-acetyl-beta-D-mannosaminyltransferase
MPNDAGQDATIQGQSILGVRVDDVTYEEALERIERSILSRSMCQIATVNVEFIMEARRNTAFRRVLTQAALCVPDGIGVLWAARRRGKPLRERVAGVDLVERIVSLGAARGWRVFFLGAAPGVAERTAGILARRYRGLIVAGCYAGSPRPEDEAAIVARVRVAEPDVLFVAYGAPSQDQWIARNQALTGAAVAMGVGGSFDFLAGLAKRAPLWMQRFGLEWLYRLLRQPWRLRRQLVIPQFMLLVLMRRE